MSENFCNDCPYYKKKHLKGTTYYKNTLKPLLFEDNGSKILLVLQAPGVEEWKIGKAIQVQTNNKSAGNRLEKSWKLKGRKRGDFDITNIVQCFPGKYKNDRDKKPKKKAIAQCLKSFEKHVEKKNYEKIIVFGKVAENAIKGLKIFSVNENISYVKHPSGGLTNIDLNNLW